MIFKNNYFCSRRMQKTPIFHLKKIIFPLLIQIEHFRFIQFVGNKKIMGVSYWQKSVSLSVFSKNDMIKIANFNYFLIIKLNFL